MTEIVIRWEKLPESIFTDLLIDLKDGVIMDKVEMILKTFIPGNYHFVAWYGNDILVEVTNDDTFALMRLMELT